MALVSLGGTEMGGGLVKESLVELECKSEVKNS